ncbi:MAG: transcriptional repressor [Lachnospiraceae bacterium]|nr:transcriptional repressor [Lachnospiraceae bacterium]
MKTEYKTKTRMAIIDYLKSNPDTRFTARDILKAVNRDGSNLDRSTVYRNLERLCREGKLVKYKETDINAACYQYSEDHGSCHDHMHAQCSECGKIFHLDNAILDDTAKKMKKEYGLEIDYGKTVIIGVCEECKQLNEKNK